MPKITKADIDHFLEGRRIAVIGVSRKEKEYSRLLFRELLKHGYDAIPVHPEATGFDGKTCYKSVKDISPAPERALIILPEEKTEQAVLDCAAAGIKEVWLHRQIGSGVSDTRAIYQAEVHGIHLITGYCLFMFLPKSSFIHKFHGRLLKMFGSYPK